jgi:Domain of unknown function (DUF4292)
MTVQEDIGCHKDHLKNSLVEYTCESLK